MKFMRHEDATRVLLDNGWLSAQPTGFQDELLRRAILVHFQPGEAVYNYGDPVGGIYGLVSGTLTVNVAPQQSLPRLIHIGVPGAWTGEGCFLTRRPRRIELRALVDVWMMHVPLKAMDELAAEDPNTIRRFAEILMASTEVVIRVVHDLMKRDPARRIASVLERLNSVGDLPIPLTQTEIGEMSNTSRKQVNAALKRFSDIGWVSSSYRSIIIHNVAKLREYAQGDE